MGAMHSGKYHEVSLDYRLKKASFYKAQVSVLRCPSMAFAPAYDSTETLDLVLQAHITPSLIKISLVLSIFSFIQRVIDTTLCLSHNSLSFTQPSVFRKILCLSNNPVFQQPSIIRTSRSFIPLAHTIFFVRTNFSFAQFFVHNFFFHAIFSFIQSFRSHNFFVQTILSFIQPFHSYNPLLSIQPSLT